MAIIEVFADVRCPFTHFGLQRFVERRAAVDRPDVRLRIRAWPLELVNAEPLDVALIDEEVQQLRAQVCPDLFRAFQRDHFGSTSLPALELVAAAYAVSVESGEHISLAMRRALFEEGRNISDPAVLADLAASAGIAVGDSCARERVIEDWHEGRERGVIGSPHFFVAGEGFFCPSLDIAHGGGRFRITVDEARLEAFVHRCLDST